MPPEEFSVYENEALLPLIKQQSSGAQLQHDNDCEGDAHISKLPLLLDKAHLKDDPDMSCAALLVLLKATHTSIKNFPPRIKNAHGMEKMVVTRTGSGWRQACARHLTNLQFRGLYRLKTDLSDLLAMCDISAHEGSDSGEEGQGATQGTPRSAGVGSSSLQTDRTHRQKRQRQA
jgi:hypothetical protein